MSINVACDLLSFIKRSPSAFHTVRSVTDRLRGEGYTELSEAEPFSLAPGGRYFVTRNGSSVIAFRLPSDGAPAPFMIAAAHTDSPSFKITDLAGTEAAGAYVRIPVERYGGMLCAPWFDRPLSAAGRVTVLTDGRIASRLVDLDRDLFLIPSVAIHMNRKANENASYNAAIDMQPIAGSSAVRGGLRRLVAEAAGAAENAILSSDLFLYPRCDGTVWGLENEFISSPRLDDLQCVFAALEGFLSAEPGRAIPVLSLCDNEEVGSETKQGAASLFLYDTLAAITEALGGSVGDHRRALAAGFLVSADNAHAVHPNHPELADPSHRPVMNGGIVIKYNAAQHYATDAVSAAIFIALCRKAGAPVQTFVNRADMGGGSTIGHIVSTGVSLNTVDVGLPQLAMHSCYETAGVKDTEYLIDAMRVLFSSALRPDGKGGFDLN